MERQAAEASPAAAAVATMAQPPAQTALADGSTIQAGFLSSARSHPPEIVLVVVIGGCLCSFVLSHSFSLCISLTLHLHLSLSLALSLKWFQPLVQEPASERASTRHGVEAAAHLVCAVMRMAS